MSRLCVLLCLFVVGMPFLARSAKTGEKEVVDALGKLHDPTMRPALLGAGLEELKGWKYGSDLVPVFKALGQGVDPQMRKMVVLRGLMVPLAAAGCARGVADSVRLVPQQQSEYVRAHCPASAPVFAASRTAGAPMELVSLAIVLEVRARNGNFAAEALHKKAIEALLGR
jgi:hypothetical protein